MAAVISAFYMYNERLDVDAEEALVARQGCGSRPGACSHPSSVAGARGVASSSPIYRSEVMGQRGIQRPWITSG